MPMGAWRAKSALFLHGRRKQRWIPLAIGVEDAIDLVISDDRTAVQPQRLIAELPDHVLRMRRDDENARTGDEPPQPLIGLLKKMLVAGADRFIDQQDFGERNGRD